MKISGGLKEDGIEVGNTFDKYGSSNPIVKKMMKGFADSLSMLVNKAKPVTIHEIGCGEGYWVLNWQAQGIKARGSDFSKTVIEIAQENAVINGVESSIFKSCSIYDIEPKVDSADLIVCCEVLEHLEDPQAGLAALHRVASDYVIVSVPREPIWCFLNMARGKYLTNFGNTPGHIQHWSKRKFVQFVNNYFEVIEVLSPLPWTMLLCRKRQEGVIS